MSKTLDGAGDLRGWPKKSPKFIGCAEIDSRFRGSLSLRGPRQHALEALPVFHVPLVQVKFSGWQQLVWFKILSLPLAHRIAHLVGPDHLYLVKVRFEVVEQEEVVRFASAQKHHGLSLILPVPRVFHIGLKQSAFLSLADTRVTLAESEAMSAATVKKRMQNEDEIMICSSS